MQVRLSTEGRSSVGGIKPFQKNATRLHRWAPFKRQFVVRVLTSKKSYIIFNNLKCLALYLNQLLEADQRRTLFLHEEIPFFRRRAYKDETESSSSVEAAKQQVQSLEKNSTQLPLTDVFVCK